VYPRYPDSRPLTDDQKNTLAALAGEPEDYHPDEDEPSPPLDISDTDIEYDAWKDDRLDPDRYR